MMEELVPISISHTVEIFAYYFIFNLMLCIYPFHDGSDAYATTATLMHTRAEASCQIRPRTKSAFSDFKGLHFVVAHGLHSQSERFSAD